MAELNTWYRQTSGARLFQTNIRHSNGPRFTIVLSGRDHIFGSDNYQDAEGWSITAIAKVKGSVVSEKISKGKPFVIKEIFSMVG